MGRRPGQLPPRRERTAGLVLNATLSRGSGPQLADTSADEPGLGELRHIWRQKISHANMRQAGFAVKPAGAGVVQSGRVERSNSQVQTALPGYMQGLWAFFICFFFLKKKQL